MAQTPKTPEKKQRRSLFGKKKEIDNTAPTAYIDAEVPLPAMSAEEEKIVAILRQNVELVDDIIAQTQLPTSQVLSALTMLEVKGVVTRLPGKRVALKTRK